MKKTVSTATALSTAIVIALGGIALSGQAALAEPVVELSSDQGTARGDVVTTTAGDEDAPTPAAATPAAVAPTGTAPADEAPVPVDEAPAPVDVADERAALDAPDAPVIASPAPDGYVSLSTAEGADGATLPVTISGTGSVSAVVTITFERLEADGASAGPITVRTGDTDRWTSTTRLASGDWSVTTTQHLVDIAGERSSEESTASAPVEFRAVAVTLPAPTIDVPEVDARYAAVGEGRATVPVAGGGEPGASVRVGVVAPDGTVLEFDGSSPVDASGRWSGDVRVPVGTWTFGAVQELVVDGTTTRTSPNTLHGTFVVESRAPLASPVVLSPREGARFDRAVDVSPGYVDTVFEGTGEPGAYLLPFSGTRAEVDEFLAAVGDVPLPPYDFPIVVGDDGTWKIFGAELPGDYFFTAVQYDPTFDLPVFSDGSEPVRYSVRGLGSGPLASGGTPNVVIADRTPAVRAAADARRLASTGSAETTPWVGLAGMVLVGLGAATVLVTRRRASRG